MKKERKFLLHYPPPPPPGGATGGGSADRVLQLIDCALRRSSPRFRLDTKPKDPTTGDAATATSQADESRR